MSSKSFPGSVTVRWESYRTPPPGVGPPSLLGSGNDSFSWIDTVNHGDNIPGWRQKLRDGVDATTTLSGSRITSYLTGGNLTISFPWNGQVWYDSISGSCHIPVGIPGSPSDISTSKSSAEALGRFNQSIRNVHTAFEGGVFIGELAQTLRMIRNPAQGIRRLADEFYDIARAIRRRSWRDGNRIKNVTEALADAWLEAQFGWRPFLNDVKDGSEALKLYSLKRDNQTRRVTGKFESRETVVQSDTATDVFGGLSISHAHRTVGTCMVIYRGAVRVEAKDPAVMDSKLVGFDPASWIPTAWELIPYSFLIDYFSNVGDVIRGWSQLGVSLAWTNMTVRRDYEVTSYSMNPGQAPGITLISFAPAKFVCRRRDVSRTKYTGSTVPDFTLRVPSLGSLRWLNIAALIASRNTDRNWVYD